MDHASYHLIETAPPGAEPLTLDDVKLHLRISHDSEDAMLMTLIAAARQMCEADTGISLITRGYSLWLDRWPCQNTRRWWDGLREGADTARAQSVLLPRPPALSVDGIYVYGADDQAVLFPTTAYYADCISSPARIVLHHGSSPPTGGRTAQNIEIRYTAGYGATPHSIPAALRQGMKQIVAYLYEHRGEDSADVLNAAGAAAFFRPFKAMRLT